tara:strand:- start:884 stop:1243 length:360 start_codon:yes stop_codon:yes gene_type:complete
MIFDIVLSLLLYSIFALIGIYIIKNNKNFKLFCNKKNLTTISIIYVLGIALLFGGDPEAPTVTLQIAMSVGNFGATFVGALIAKKIFVKKKNIFSEEFYHALIGSIIGGSVLLLLAYGL